MEQYNFGLIGLGVMGRNFIMNVADNGYSAIGLARDPKKVEALNKEGEGKPVYGTRDMKEFVNKLETPRIIMLLVTAGDAVDSVINNLIPLVSEGDLIIDGGNSFYSDTDRRYADLKKRNIHFIGSGVSGGSKGARFGPSIMPGGDKEAYSLVEPIFKAVAAKVNGEPCVAHMGNVSAGNYVKMVHNGIEYGLMQLIAEVYDVLKKGIGLSNTLLHQTFDGWNQSRLQSFLIEITADIFSRKDDLTSEYLVDMILDKAKQKGTGKWTSQNAMDLGTPVPSIDAAVTMREISAFKNLRKDLDKSTANEPLSISVENVENALYTAFICTYAQGMAQLKEASAEYNYDLNLATISKIWRGGCIIRAALLEDMYKAYNSNPDLEHMLADSIFANHINENIEGLRKVVSFMISKGLPAMCLSTSLAYIDAMRSDSLPMNLVQAQRDHFGEHTYERIDREGIFHYDW